MELLGEEAQVEALFGQFGDCANLEVDRCIVCTKRTIVLEIILDALHGTPRRRGSIES
jgi:hypothetical protein